MITHSKLIAAGYQFQRGNPAPIKQALRSAGFSDNPLTWYGHPDGRVIGWAVKLGASNAMGADSAYGDVACAVYRGGSVRLHYDRGFPVPSEIF